MRSVRVPRLARRPPVRRLSYAVRYATVATFVNMVAF